MYNKNDTIAILISGHIRSLQCAEQQLDYRTKIIEPLRKKYRTNIFATLVLENDQNISKHHAVHAVAALNADFFILEWNMSSTTFFEFQCLEAYKRGIIHKSKSYLLESYTMQWIRIHQIINAMLYS